MSLGVSDLERSRRFYDAALRPLGPVRIVDFGHGSDYGAGPGSLGVEFTITREINIQAPAAGAHLCFRGPSAVPCGISTRQRLRRAGRMTVPGLRPQYHADYYGAFVLDLDGRRIEAVCHAPETPLVLGAG